MPPTAPPFGARRAVAGLALAALLATTGCSAPSSIAVFDRPQATDDPLPPGIPAGDDMDLDSMRRVGDFGGKSYYLAQDSIPGSPAVCLYIVEGIRGHGDGARTTSTSSCGMLPLSTYTAEGGEEARVEYPGTPTPDGFVRLDGNVVVSVGPGAFDSSTPDSGAFDPDDRAGDRGDG